MTAGRRTPGVQPIKKVTAFVTRVDADETRLAADSARLAADSARLAADSARLAADTRLAAGETRLLVFEHPTAGIQLPAGTVEPGERWPDAALRETLEETGLDGLRVAGLLGQRTETHPDGLPMLSAAADLLAEPRMGAAPVLRMQRGWAVHREGPAQDGFCLVSLREYDSLSEPRRLLWSRTGWLPGSLLATCMRRRFYHLLCSGPTAERWVHGTPGLRDMGHTFRPFWTPLARQVGLVAPQDSYLEQVYEALVMAVSAHQVSRWYFSDQTDYF